MQKHKDRLGQQSFDPEVESFSEREKLIIRRLREFYTIDRDIREAEEWARGDNLPFEPSVTAGGPHDDDPIVRRILQQDVLSTEAQEVVNTVRQYVLPDRFTFAATYRVTRHF